MNYTIETIGDFCGGTSLIAIPGSMVRSVIIDHRDPNRNGAMFAAFKGSRTDGHRFIPELIEQGVRHFLISEEQVAGHHQGKANFIIVPDVTTGLQRIAAKHRAYFTLPVIAVTGSNGKTVVKEWLNTLLEDNFDICRSPKSFNSQIGVALSVLQLAPNHTLGIFEAGISRPGEMSNLERILKPGIGIFTNLGDAHAAHFESERAKFNEKWLLFAETDKVICRSDQQWFEWLDENERKRCFTWSDTHTDADVFITRISTGPRSTLIDLKYKGRDLAVEIPFADKASVENALHCLCVLLLLEHGTPAVLARFAMLMHVAMRLEVKQGIEQSVLIDDSYNADLGSLRVALEQLVSMEGRERLVILTDLSDNLSSQALYSRIAAMLEEAQVSELVGIGQEIERYRDLFSFLKLTCYPDADSYWNTLVPRSLRGKAILIKGARRFKLEQLVKRLQAQQHETVLEVDLHKLAENLKFFRSHIRPGVKIMVMVKAFSYGSGGFEIAGFLQTQRVDYLAVAYADEGIELRRHGIRMPIMVMSPSKAAYEGMIKNKLEPEIYSLRSLLEFIESARSLRHLFETLHIHLKIDSGMHRLGFQKDDMEGLLAELKEASFIRVVSIFTHLGAADNAKEDTFSQGQIREFLDFAGEMESALGYPVMKHALNSTGILRFPEYQLDMVRLGIGLYGFSGTDHNKFLHSLGTLKSYIVQTREVPARESVGYNRRGGADQPRTIATVAIGYADGLDRRLGNGNWRLKWQGTACATVGDICMDMCMIDVSGTAAREGDEVIVFDGALEIEQMASQLGTIPYEILTKVSQRVRRVFLQE